MVVRLVFATVLIAGTALLLHPAVRDLMSSRHGFRAFQCLFVASRLSGWLVVYVALAGLSNYSDLALYYYPEASLAVDGRVPYVDFATSYGPLFPYLSGLFLVFWRTEASVALVMVLVEIATVLLVSSAVRANKELPRDAATSLLGVYLLNPAALYWSGMMGYNSSIIQLCWVVAVGFLLRGTFAASIVALAMSVVAGKFLGALAAPIWLGHPDRRYSTLSVAAIVAAATWSVGNHYGIDFTMPLIREGDRSTAGNLWFLASGLVSIHPQVWRYGPPILFAASAAWLITCLRHNWQGGPSLQQVSGAISAVGWLFLVVSKKSYPHYSTMFLVFTIAALCVGPKGSRWSMLLALVGAVGIIEPGLWNALDQPQSLAQISSSQPEWLLLLGADGVLVAGAASLAWGSIRIATGSSEGLIRRYPR